MTNVRTYLLFPIVMIYAVVTHPIGAAKAVRNAWRLTRQEMDA